MGNVGFGLLHVTGKEKYCEVKSKGFYHLLRDLRKCVISFNHCKDRAKSHLRSLMRLHLAVNKLKLNSCEYHVKITLYSTLLVVTCYLYEYVGH